MPQFRLTDFTDPEVWAWSETDLQNTKEHKYIFKNRDWIWKRPKNSNAMSKARGYIVLIQNAVDPSRPEQWETTNTATSTMQRVFFGYEVMSPQRVINCPFANLFCQRHLYLLLERLIGYCRIHSSVFISVGKLRHNLLHLFSFLEVVEESKSSPESLIFRKVEL